MLYNKLIRQKIYAGIRAHFLKNGDKAVTGLVKIIT